MSRSQQLFIIQYYFSMILEIKIINSRATQCLASSSVSQKKKLHTTKLQVMEWRCLSKGFFMRLPSTLHWAQFKDLARTIMFSHIFNETTRSDDVFSTQTSRDIETSSNIVIKTTSTSLYRLDHHSFSYNSKKHISTHC